MSTHHGRPLIIQGGEMIETASHQKKYPKQVSEKTPLHMSAKNHSLTLSTKILFPTSDDAATEKIKAQWNRDHKYMRT